MAAGEEKAKAKKLRLGGMALRNGLLVHGPTHWAAAVRRPDGSIEVASERKPELVPRLVTKVPRLPRPVEPRRGDAGPAAGPQAHALGPHAVRGQAGPRRDRRHPRPLQPPAPQSSRHRRPRGGDPGDR